MGCGNCGTGANGSPAGCRGNGGCSSGGCNRLNVYNWLSDLPLHDAAKPFPIVEMSFNKGSRKEFFRNNTHHILDKGNWFAVEGVGGYDIGQVSLTGELVKLQLKKYGVREHEVTKRILHPATPEELDHSSKQKDREQEVLIRSRAIAKTLKLDMKLCEVEIQADSKKGTFFYTADQRVDFRELIRVYASDFKMKIEMKQIGARQESGKVGGIGSCGRELCCSTWLTDFKSVNTTAARYQNLSINQAKLSGQCGRLKCCLNYELDTYMDALSVFPDNAEHLETIKGVAHLQKKDIFKNLMWYSYSDNNKQYPLSIDRVREIVKQNKLGQKAEELQPVEIEVKEISTGKPKVADMGFVNDVGQMTLKSLEKNKKKKQKPQGSGGNAGKPQGGQQQGRPQQNAGGRQQQAKEQQPGQGSQQNKPQQGGGQQKQPNSGQQQKSPQQNRPQQGGGQQKQQQPRPQQNKTPNQQPRPNQPQQEKPNQPQENKGRQGGGNRPQQPRPPRPDNRKPQQPNGDTDNKENNAKQPSGQEA